jgi:gamma-D-glutamyl-L-lysine dipeptidyl-peptidase
MAAIDYGICRLSVVAVRPGSGSVEQLSQLLFGEHYIVESQSKDHKWLQITTHDGLTGWIDRLQHHSVSLEYFNQVSNSEFKITTDIVSTILYKKSPVSIVLGSIVPISGSELFKMEEQFAFNGESKSLGQRRDFEYMKGIANRYINAPQQIGGRNPFGIDAAGLVHMVFRIGGYNLPRAVQAQFNLGKKVKDAKPGDLVFFGGKDGKPNHVGIVLDEQKIIHCSGRVRIDHLMEDRIFVAETKLFTHEMVGLRRVLQ